MEKKPRNERPVHCIAVVNMTLLKTMEIGLAEQKENTYGLISQGIFLLTR